MSEPIFIDTNYESEAAEDTSPWGSVIGAVTGIGGLILSIFEWYYQQKLQRGEEYWNNLITDTDQEITGFEQDASYYQSMAEQAAQQESSYSNAVFSAPNKSARSHYQLLEDQAAQKQVMYQQLANYEKTLISNAEKQVKSYQNSESHFSLLNHFEQGLDSSTRQEMVSRYEKYVKNHAKTSESILQQISSLQKQLSNPNLTLAQFKQIMSELKNLNSKMEANKQKWQFNPTKNDFTTDIALKISPVLKTVITKGEKTVDAMKRHGIHDHDVIMTIPMKKHIIMNGKRKTVIKKRPVKH